jgi:hypothetical protein
MIRELRELHCSRSPVIQWEFSPHSEVMGWRPRMVNHVVRPIMRGKEVHTSILGAATFSQPTEN